MPNLGRRIAYVTNPAYATLLIATVLMALWAFMAAAAGAAAPRNHAGEKLPLIQVVTPKKQEILNSQPVTVSVKFNGTVDISSFRAWLNGKNVTQHFTVSASGADANLDERDGLRIDGGPLVKNNLRFRVWDRAKGGESTAKRKTYFARRNFYFDGPGPKVEGFIPKEGGRLTLKDRATIIFPPGAFPNVQPVELSETSSPETADDFEFTESWLDEGSQRTQYELRLNTGMVAPQTDLQAIITVPSDFLASVPADSDINVFVQIFGSEHEILDHFEMFESVYSTADNTITVTLPPEAFTNQRQIEDTYEAIFLLATTPKRPSSPAKSLLKSRGSIMSPVPDPLDKDAFQLQDLMMHREEPQLHPPDAIIEPAQSSNARVLQAPAATGAICRGFGLGPPLDNLDVTSAYSPSKRHYGTDCRATEGTVVRSMDGGVVELIKFNEKPLKKPDPRSGKMVNGYGRYVVIRHPPDDFRTLYAHLQKDGVKKR